MHAFMYTKTEVQDMLAMKRKPQPVLLKTLQDYEQSIYNEFKTHFETLMQRKPEVFTNYPILDEQAEIFENEINLTDLLTVQKTLDRAILHKLKRQENTFVHFVEADEKDEYLQYTDSYPLLKQRKRLWGSYLVISERAKSIITSNFFETVVSLAIITNCLMMGFDDPMATEESTFSARIELFFFVIYILEMVLKITALGFIFKRGAYLRDPWNILDFLIIFASIASLIKSDSSSNSINFSSLRTLRILRPLRTINVIKKLRALIMTILDSIPYLFDILLIILFTMGVFAIAGLQLFRGVLLNRCFEATTGRPMDLKFNDSQLCGGSQTCASGYICAKGTENPLSGMFSFDNVFDSYLLVFITITMEGWSVANNYVIYTYSWFSIAYFILIVFIASFFLFNLALAIISAKFNEAQEGQKEDPNHKYLNKTHDKLYWKYFSLNQHIKGHKLKEVAGVPFPKLLLYSRERYGSLSKISHIRKSRHEYGIYDVINRQLDLDSMEHLEKVMDNIYKGDDIEPTNVPDVVVFNNERFFSRRRKEFELLRNYLRVNRMQDRKPESEPRDLKSKYTWDPESKDIPRGTHQYGNMADLEMEESQHCGMDYRLTPSESRVESGSNTAEKEERYEIKIPKVEYECQDDSNLDLLKLSEAPGVRPRGISSSVNQFADVRLPELVDSYHQHKNAQTPKKASPSKPVVKPPNSLNKPYHTPHHLQDSMIYNSNDLAMYRSIEFHDKINVSGIDEIRQLLIDMPEMKSGKRAPLNYMAAAHLLYSSVQSNHRDHHVSPFAPLPIESLERLGESKYSEGQMLTDRRKERGSTPMHPHVDEDEDENSEELAVRMSRLNYEIFLNNFLDNEKEYTYQTWNHFASRRLVSGIKRIRKKRKIVDDDFTEEEKLLKGILEKKDIKLISKDVCLTYQYSPECCFNSMVDVIPIRRLSKPLDVVDSTEKPKHITQVYNPRIFMEERDSLYQTGEFPPDTEPSKVYTRMGSFIREKMSKSAKLKMKIEVDSKYIKHKDMFPIRFPNCPKELIQRSYGNLKLRSFLRQKSPMSKEYHKLTSTSEDQITFDFLSDRFLTDFVEVDSKHIEHSMENPTDILPEDMYSGIIEMESNSDTVGILNWSGEQVYSKKIYKRRRTHQVVEALNFPDTEIWLRGCLGCIKTFRKYLRAFVESTLVDRFLTFCVLMNTFILMLEGLTSDDIGLFLDILNSVFTIIFILELFIKLSALGFKKYVQNYFNIFDAVIVCISIIEFSISLTTSEGGTTSGSKISAFRALRILRMFRVLRVTRILRSMKFMRVIVAVIVETAEQYTYVAIILLLFIYIYSLLGMQIYAGKLQYEDVKPRLNFDSFSAAAVTLFQLLTFENWTDVVEACYKSSVSHAVTMVFILSWLIIGNYIIFNLFLALLLGGFDSDNVIKSLEENTDEFKELQMGIIRQKELNLKEKERIKSIEAKQNKEVDYFIQSENNDGVGNDDMFIEFMDETQKKSRACYTVFRNTINDESSLQELMYNTLEERLRPRIFVKLIDLNRDIYDGVECDVSLFLFRKDNCFRIIAAHIVSHPWFEPVIMFLIVLSSMKLVVETYFSGNDNEKESKIFDWFDNIINCLFVLECVFKILRNGFILDKNCYLSDGWSWLDFLIMATSTLDMILTDLSLPMIKIFRTLRPLRFIARYKNMRVIVNSLLGVLGPLLNVTLVMMLVWLIFAILGMNFLGGKLGYCDIDNYYGVSKEQCEQLGQRWRRAFWNFDNIGESFVTLFVLVSMEGWPALVASSLDIGDSETSGPIYNNNPWIMIYYLAFILIGAMFLMDLFTGVIFYQYGIELEKEISMTCTNCTDDQVKWIMIQKLIYSASSNFAFIETPKNKLRYMFFKLVSSSYFEIALLLAVLLNIVIMGMDYEGMGDNYEKTLDIINDCLVWVFCLEFLLKLTAFGCNYFTDKWNIMDTVILALSIADFFLGILGISSNSKIAIGPQIARALRIIRITRLFKLFKSKHMEAFMKLINTLIFSLPTILNVFALLLVIYFIFAVIGCFIFKNADLPSEFDSAVLNFHNFHMGLLTLFRLSTGEDWPLVMYNYGESKGNYLIARIYFMVYIFITTFVMLNLFELVIVQIFESFYFDPDNVLASFEQISMEFNKAWNCFTVSTQGKKIKVGNLPRFFAHLE